MIPFHDMSKHAKENMGTHIRTYMDSDIQHSQHSDCHWGGRGTQGLLPICIVLFKKNESLITPQ